MDKARLKKLILPLALEQLLGVSVGIIDTFMVAKVGEAAVSGVSLVDSINLLIIQIMAAFAAGGIVIISQYIGEKNEHMAQKACAHLEMLIGIFSLLVMFIGVFFGKGILSVIFRGIEPDVMKAARTYLLISAISLVFWGIYTSGAAVLRCYEDTKTAMKVSMLMNLLNVVLNAVFVFGFKMGVFGVAIATLISRAVAGITMKVITVSPKKEFRIKDISMYKPSLAVAKNILAMGIPSGIENGMFHVGKIVLAGVVATLGTSAIAANSIAYQIIEFPNIPGNTIGLALVVLVGQEIGASNKKGATDYTKYLIRLAYICDWICKAVLFVTAPIIVSAFSLSGAAQAQAVLVLRCFSVASLLIWPLSFTMPSALRGAGDVRYSMVVSVISMWLARVMISIVLVKVFNLGILGIWLGMFADWYVRGIGYLLRFKSGKWLEKKAI